MRNMKAGLSILALCAAASAAQAAPNLVQNGNFTTLANGSATTATQVATVDNTNSNYYAGGANPSGVTAITLGGGWKNDGYTYAFTPGSADTAGSASSEYNGVTKLAGPGDGFTNGLPSADPLPGAGGVFLGLDGDYQQGALYQSISGLTVGLQYVIGFDWAAAQQLGYNQATTQQILVGIGSTLASSSSYQFTTPVITIPAQSFSPWVHQAFTFTANATTETLSFFASATPSGAPPFSLLDNVSLTAAPEPTTWAVMVAGLAALGFGGRFWRRGRTNVATSAA